MGFIIPIGVGSTLVIRCVTLRHFAGYVVKLFTMPTLVSGIREQTCAYCAVQYPSSLQVGIALTWRGIEGHLQDMVIAMLL